MIAYYIDLQDSPFNKRVKYVFDFIQNHPLSKNKVLFTYDKINSNYSISYGKPSDVDFYIPAQGLLFTPSPQDPDSYITNKYSYPNLDIYSVEKKKKIEKELLIENQFSFDIVETIFFHISRYEEHIIKPDMLFNWGMASKENHFIPRNNLQEIPIVDHLVFAFLEAIGAQPKKQKTSFRLTHDVDNPLKLPNFYKLIKASGRLLLVDKKGPKAQRELFRVYRKMQSNKTKDPYDTFDWLFRDEGSEKVVYFMAGGITKFDNYYNIDSPIARRIVAQAQSKGYQIGLHPSYAAYASKELYTKEKKALEQVLGEKVELARQHYLRFQFPKTADIIDRQGISEDSTLGYRDQIGFRCGTGFGYRLYNFKKEEAYLFVETPLVIMEGSLIQQNNRDFKKIKKHLAAFLRDNQFHTKVTILFHNSIFDQVGTSYNELQNLYFDLIKKIN